MPALLDARPPGLDLHYRPATTVTLVLNWPAGALAGRTFTSTLGADQLLVEIDGDTMTVEASATQTDVADGTATAWRLLEELGGADPEPLMVGTWAASDHAAARPAGLSVTVTDGVVAVDVSATAAGLLSSGREVAGPSVLTASSATFNANLGFFGIQDVLTSGGAIAHEFTVPAGLSRPVWLELDTSVQASVAGAAVGIAIVPSSVASPAIITSAVQHRLKTLPTAGRNEHVAMRARLPAGTSGAYKIMGGVIGGGTGLISAAASGPSIFSAIEH